LDRVDDVRELLFDFAIVGAYKCGTTSLYASLNKHPDIALPSSYEKEVDLFHDNETYRLGSKYWSSYYEFEQHQLLGNGHNVYMTSHVCINRLQAHNKKIKLIAIIREPVKRAWSHYLYDVSKGVESRLFSQVVKDELSYFEQNGYAQHGGLLDSGLYGFHLNRYLNVFPQNQLHVIFFEEFILDPDKCLKQLFTFLGVDHSFRVPDSSKKLNPAVGSKNLTIAKTITFILRTPSRRVKKCFRLFFRRASLIKLKKWIVFVEKLNSIPLKKTDIPDFELKMLTEFYKNDKIILRKLLGYLPPEWNNLSSSHEN